MHREIPTVGLWLYVYWYEIRDTATYPAPKLHARVPARVSLQSMRAVDYSMPSLIDVIRVRKVVDAHFFKGIIFAKREMVQTQLFEFFGEV